MDEKLSHKVTDLAFTQSYTEQIPDTILLELKVVSILYFMHRLATFSDVFACAKEMQDK